MLDLPSSLMPNLKLPVKLDFDDTTGIQGLQGMQEHLYHAYSDWDNTMHPRPGSLAAQHHHQHQRLSELLPPAPLVTSASPFTFDLASHLATHTTHTSTTNTTSAFKSVAGKHLASSILPALSTGGLMASEGSSVDPTTKPLDFASLAKIPQSCLNSVSSVPPSSFSPSLPFSCSSSPSVPTPPATSKSNGSCHGPPCSRPAPLGGNPTASKWERTHPQQHCKKYAPGSGLLNKQLPGAPGQPHLPGGLQAPQNFFQNLRSNLPCSHAASNPMPKPGGLSPHLTPPAANPTTTSAPVPASSVPMSCMNPQPTAVSNINMGTSTPCTDPDCEAHHHDDNCDSVDDSCSEKSSSTSTSNQKEGKYCDCCYCEFFGHNNTQVAKTSTNYIEIKDRLRKKLKKRQTEGKLMECSKEEELKDPLEKKGLEGLLSFINGTDEEAKAKDKELTAKAAKRARQKQKKLEEKARLENSSSPDGRQPFHQPQQPEDTLRQLLHQTLSLANPPSLDPRLSMAKPKSKKPRSTSGKKDGLDEISMVKNFLSPSKQEINRSSLIIESTRPTISLSAKDVDKNPAPPQRLTSKETSQQMINILDALQSFKQKQEQQQQEQQQRNKSKSSSASQVVSSNGSPQTKSNGSVGPVTKPGVDTGRMNGSGKPVPQQSHQVQQQQQQQRPQLQKQQQSVKSVNGKSSALPQPAASNSHVANGYASPASKRAQPQQHLHMNGGVTKGQTGKTTVATPPPPVSTPSLPPKNSVVDSPSTGSGSSASQSPSSGTKAAADQGKSNAKAKKNKKKNKNGDISGVDEIFMPKSESEMDGDVDDFERELEEFKRFCFEPAAEPKERRKIAVNVNLKDIFKKKSGMV